MHLGLLTIEVTGHENILDWGKDSYFVKLAVEE